MVLERRQSRAIARHCHGPHAIRGPSRVEGTPGAAGSFGGAKTSCRPQPSLLREHLGRDPVYSNLIGNRGAVLELLGRHNEAQQHFDEATEFMPGA